MNRILRKTIWLVGSCCAVLIVCLFLLFAQKSDKIAYLGNLLAENTHTGLIESPVARIAFNDQDRDTKQFASTVAPAGQTNLSANSNIAGQIPTVLFDISSRPLFGKNNRNNILAVLSVSIIVFLLVLFFANFIRKKIRARKIKLIMRNK